MDRSLVQLLVCLGTALTGGAILDGYGARSETRREGLLVTCQERLLHLSV